MIFYGLRDVTLNSDIEKSFQFETAVTYRFYGHCVAWIQHKRIPLCLPYFSWFIGVRFIYYERFIVFVVFLFGSEKVGATKNKSNSLMELFSLADNLRGNLFVLVFGEGMSCRNVVWPALIRARLSG